MPHMAKNPFTVNGLVDGDVDGRRDAARLRSCPALEPLGPDPAKAWSWRYRQAYEAVMDGAKRHQCTGMCAGMAR